MTEKRFDVIYEEDEEYKNIRYWEIIDRKNNAKTSNELKLCHLLNLLNEENEQLKEILHFLRNDNAEDILNVLNTQQNEIVRVIEENEQLKSELKYYKAMVHTDTSR